MSQEDGHYTTKFLDHYVRLFAFNFKPAFTLRCPIAHFLNQSILYLLLLNTHYTSVIDGHNIM